MDERMPVFFFGHGNPMNAITKNRYSDAWRAIGQTLPCPKAVLAVSAHWYIPYCAVTVNAVPPTIHDFGGFPQALYQVVYNAPGSPELAKRIKGLLSFTNVTLDEGWGLDHGTWSILMHLLPKADIPVVQLGINEKAPASVHYETGKKLFPLREEGVLVIGSGNLVHNLHSYSWGDPDAPPYDWTVRFEDQVKDLILKGEDEKLVSYKDLGPDAARSVPTPDHYLPLLYVLGLRGKDEKVSFPVEGVDGGSVSMLSIRIG